MTGINASMTDMSVNDDLRTGRPLSTMICVLVAHCQQIKQISSMCERFLKVTEGKLWTKPHKRLEFLYEVVTVHVFFNVLNIRCMCQHLVPQMLISEQ